MKIAYHNTIPIPRISNTDAVCNEFIELSQVFEGQLINLFPSDKHRFWTIKELIGIRSIRGIRALDRTVDIHHVTFPFFYNFPYFRLLNKPVVYTASSSQLPSYKSIPNTPNRTYVCASESVVSGVKRYAPDQIYHIIPGINTAGWESRAPSSSMSPFRLLMASAPHSRDQFSSKQIYLLLDYVKRTPDVELTLIWRGVDADYMQQLIERDHLQDRVHLINQKVSMQRYYDQSHATLLLCDQKGVLKNYPHSLMESICCGRPVILSATTELARMVESHSLGVIMNDYSIDTLNESVQELKSSYHIYQSNCQSFDKDRIDKTRYHREIQNVYQKVLGQ